MSKGESAASSSSRFVVRERLKSFVSRGRLTDAQRRGLEKHIGAYLLSPQQPLNCRESFGHERPTIVEIGFGDGETMFQSAKNNPEYNFVGIETYLPGTGRLLNKIADEQLQNLKLYRADALEILSNCIEAQSLTAILVYFPDPWPKRRHHKRRLLRPIFWTLAVRALESGGLIHIATDSSDYADSIANQICSVPALTALSADHRSVVQIPLRHGSTRFEDRACRAQRQVREFLLRAY